jgi:hypothetical protein
VTKVALDEQVVLWTNDHMTKYGENDIFPPLLEMSFIRDKRLEIAGELAQVDLATHRPISLTESLIAKSKVGFRHGHQIYPSDSILFTASTVTIAGDIERRRKSAAFSYRFNQQSDGNLFLPHHRYRNWLRHQLAVLAFMSDIEYVVRTDIADFYSRIYFHRLENCLFDYAGESGFAKYILKCIKDWRSRQSIGLPVGSNAARILAEAVLCDIDDALTANGWHHSRYVDDFVIFVRRDQDPYAALAFLAERLSSSEILSLNTQKTHILAKDAYLTQLRIYSGETTEEAAEVATEQLFWDAYGSDDPDDEALLELKARDLIGELDKELESDVWEVGRIKVLLNAVRLTKPSTAAEYMRTRLSNLMPFSKEVVLLMEELSATGEASFTMEGEQIVGLLGGPRAAHLPVVRSWLWYLLTTNVVSVNIEQINRLNHLDHIFDARGQYAMRMKLKDLTYFRRLKSRIDELSPWHQPALIHAAGCLPHDEYEKWIGSLKGRVRFPLATLFFTWCLEQQSERRDASYAS